MLCAECRQPTRPSYKMDPPEETGPLATQIARLLLLVNKRHVAVLAGAQAAGHPSLASKMVLNLVKGLSLVKYDSTKRFLGKDRLRYCQALAHRFLHVGLGL